MTPRIIKVILEKNVFKNYFANLNKFNRLYINIIITYYDVIKVTSNLPEIFTKFIPSEDKVEEFLLKCEHHYSTNQQPLEYDETTIIQSYVAIIAGACLSIGFRFMLFCIRCFSCLLLNSLLLLISTLFIGNG